jgi:putative ABC transport system substrate-binding protein
MRRREFIALLGGIAGSWSLPVRAQQASTATVGLLWPGAGPPVSPRLESFREGLRRSGFVEGQNVAMDLRYVQAGQQTLADHAADLVRAKVAVIATFGDSATKIAQQATSTIPIVSLADDLLGSGLIGSLSRPGANTTGITILAPELSAKRLELLSTIVPGLARVAGLWDPTTGESQVAMSENAARTMKLKLQILEVTQRDDLDGVFRAARDAHNVFSSPFLASLYLEIINRAAEYRLPTIYQWREHAEAGGLISYGPSLPVMWEQDGALVAKVLKGAEPSGLPVEQPTKFELVINLKTARALGLTVSSQMQLLADEVIE